MIVEVRKAGMVLLRTDLATVIEMFATGAGTFRPRCADLSRELEYFSISRPFELIVVGNDEIFGGLPVKGTLREIIEPEPDEDDPDDQADGSKK